jgi:NAD+ diphosphatase
MSAVFFAGFPLDRASARRSDAAYLAAAQVDPGARLLLLQGGKPFVTAPAGPRGPREIAWMAASTARSLAGSQATVLFLGVDDGGAAHFAVEAPADRDLAGDDGLLTGLGDFEELRGIGPLLSPGDAALIGAAKSVVDWHARHGFCAVCGTATEPASAGWKRTCPSCGAEHFPRVDPVAIMLPVRGERCLLGRQSRFPKGMYSALAGFVEPGETIAEACAREIAEEVGLTVVASRIVADQPWPFPSQLMIGLIAEVADEAVTLDKEEIEETIWITREEARALIAGPIEKGGARIWSPPPMAIAHTLLKAWAEDA